MSLHITRKVVRHEIIITVLDDAVKERGEGACIPEAALVDLVEDLGELGLQLVVLVEVCVA